MDPMQRSLLDESIDADIEAICLEIERSSWGLLSSRAMRLPARSG